MKYSIFLLIAMVFSGCSLQKVESQKKMTDDSPKVSNSAKQKVLVELFTSEGCSSCPPADKALAFLQEQQPIANAEVIALGFHVDYWDYIGWKDIYAKREFTRRQENYAEAFRLSSNYTPQMVVDGSLEFVGNNSKKANNAIASSIQNQKGNVELTRTGDKLSIKITAVPKHSDSTVFLTIAEDNLSSDVKRGENSGSKLIHQAVVRELSAIGSITSEQTSANFETSVNLKSDWKKQDVKFVVFIQENESKKVLGVNQIK
jgi:hypothetical protein